MIKLCCLIIIMGLTITTGYRSTVLRGNSTAGSKGKTLVKHWAVNRLQQSKVQHGAGERGNDVSKVASHGAPEYVKTHPEFPFIVVFALCPEHLIWSGDILLD
jgi:hypothetical protein